MRKTTKGIAAAALFFGAASQTAVAGALCDADSLSSAPIATSCGQALNATDDANMCTRTDVEAEDVLTSLVTLETIKAAQLSICPRRTAPAPMSYAVGNR